VPREVLLAVVFINLALIFYTTGVWWERLAGKLRPAHLALFWGGCLADSAGTEMMYRILGRIELNLHGITGLTALTLMLAHALWASWVLWRGDEKARREFHRYSTLVWLVWLVPYLTGYLLSLGGP